MSDKNRKKAWIFCLGICLTTQINLYGQQLEVEGDIDLKNNTVTQLGAPTLAMDGVSKSYVDNLVFDFLVSLGSEGIQALLDSGHDPIDLIAAGVEVDSLYGRVYQGGQIFYLDDQDTLPGIKGMVAAPTDQGTAQWGCEGTEIMGADGFEIGTGSMNTAEIEAGCTENNFAADICAHLDLNGFTDWFLPSLDELNTMYLQIGPGANGPNDNIGDFAPTGYWSSTENNENQAGQILFGSGTIDIEVPKDSSGGTRAVRSF